MGIIITYDIPRRHVDFKQAMFAMQYKEQIQGTNCTTIYFPNTTLYHATKDAKTARSDAQRICAELGVELERCVATNWGPNWAAICGKTFS